MNTAARLVGSALVAALPACANAASFTPMGQPGSQVAALSADGCVAAGNVSGGGFRWRVGGAIVALDAAISVRALSASGRYAAGSSLDAERREVASWWDADGRVHRLGGAPGVDAISVVSQAFGVTDEPRVVGGVGSAASAFVWSPRTGLAVLPAPDARGARAQGISDDGAIVYGWRETSAGERRGTVWSHGAPRALVDHAGRAVREVVAANRAASVLVGVLGDDATYRWSDATGIVPLPADDAPQWFGASDDGRVLVGSTGHGDARRATVWTQEAGAQPLAAWLAARGAALPPDWRAHAVTAVSGDGARIAGWGTHAGRFDSFVLDTASTARSCGGDRAAAP